MPNPIHDTHVHLDLLLEFLGILTDVRAGSFEKELATNPGLQNQIQVVIDKHLLEHSFVIQSTVSTPNFEFIQQILPQKNNPKLKLLLGSHPEIVKENFDLKNYLAYQQKLVHKFQQNYPFIGIGETGLDYHYTTDSNLIAIQKKLFESQIQLAIETNTTLVIHCRDAFSDLIQILKLNKEIHGKFLIHCFTGDTEILKQILDLGGKAAYGGIITFGSSANDLRDSLKYCPNDSFVLETDLPYLTPTPHRGQTNLPEFINLIATKAAEIRQQSLEQIWSNSYKNTLELFRGLS